MAETLRAPLIQPAEVPPDGRRDTTTDGLGDMVTVPPEERGGLAANVQGDIVTVPPEEQSDSADDMATTADSRGRAGGDQNPGGELVTSTQESRPCRQWPCRRWIGRLRASVWRPEPSLPLHRAARERQEKLADKRQALFGVVLAAPLALLTSAAGMSLFPSAFIPWIVVLSLIIWVAMSSGLLMDLCGKTSFEFRLASCLGRLGMLAVTVLFFLFVFGAFYPSETDYWWVSSSVQYFYTVACACTLGGPQKTTVKPTDDDSQSYRLHQRG